MEISDIILSSVTILFTLLAILIFVLGLMRSERPKKGILIKKRKILMPILIAITFSLFILIWIYPMFIGYNWAALLVWQPYSLVTALISLAVLSTSVTWFVWQGSK